LEGQSTDTCWILETLEATHSLGQALAQRLPALSLLLLEGSLGAGKTSLVQGLAVALSIDEPITSPTFALAQHY
ncbi:MAG: tRNA (adenosine(37)-N6)-threonylcarbamoyltransferase complex ATPase subunit type 1 TsaE, partial [Prochlorococcus sp.]